MKAIHWFGIVFGIVCAALLAWSVYDQVKNPGQEPVPIEDLQPQSRRSVLDPDTKAECAMCFDMQCMNSSICGGSGCFCFKRGMDLWGSCASINAQPPGSYIAW